jgi:hypothetical protein
MARPPTCAAGFVAEALTIATEAGCTGVQILHADAKFYTADVVAACRRAGAHFWLTTGMDPSIAAAIGTIPRQRWTAIRYPRAILDPQTGELISDAEVAEIQDTACASRRPSRSPPACSCAGSSG